jgi:hypothetical protein
MGLKQRGCANRREPNWRMVGRQHLVLMEDLVTVKVNNARTLEISDSGVTERGGWFLMPPMRQGIMSPWRILPNVRSQLRFTGMDCIAAFWSGGEGDITLSSHRIFRISLLESLSS